MLLDPGEDVGRRPHAGVARGLHHRHVSQLCPSVVALLCATLDASLLFYDSDPGAIEREQNDGAGKRCLGVNKPGRRCRAVR